MHVPTCPDRSCFKALGSRENGSPTSSSDFSKGPPKLPRLAIPLLPESNSTVFDSCFCKRTCRSWKSIFWQMSRTSWQLQESVLAVVTQHTDYCLCAQTGLLRTSASWRSGLRCDNEKYCRILRGRRQSLEREKQLLTRDSACMLLPEFEAPTYS